MYSQYYYGFEQAMPQQTQHYAPAASSSSASGLPISKLTPHAQEKLQGYSRVAYVTAIVDAVYRCIYTVV
jgi:hypothetical protein